MKMFEQRLSWVPIGLGEQKPHHYLEMLRVAWKNRDELPFAWRILRERVMRAPMRPGNLEVHWPEGMTLLGATLDPESLEPDDNAVVTIEPANGLYP